MLIARGDKTAARGEVRHLSSINHEGKVVIVVTVTQKREATQQQQPQPDLVWLEYTVRQEGFEDSAIQPDAHLGWESFKKLPLPNDPGGDASVIEREQQELALGRDRYLMRSLYDTAELTADAPVQLVSHEGHLYVFRQSLDNHLLVDRFVLDGLTNTLTPKMEVRYRRSRQRYRPTSETKVTGEGQLDSADSYDFRDTSGKPFFEPTTMVCPAVLNEIVDGFFAVVVTPTTEIGTYRWHFFHCGRASATVRLLSLRSGTDQIFAVFDQQFRTINEAGQGVYTKVPALIERAIRLVDAEGQPVIHSQGLTAVKYDVQREQSTDSGPQLLRDATKVMIAVSRPLGVGVLSFAVAADGTLAEIAPPSAHDLLLGREKNILLPTDVLDNIRAIGESTPPPTGTIRSLERSTNAAVADRVRVRVAASDTAALRRLQVGDAVRLANTHSYDGLHTVQTVEGKELTLTTAVEDGRLGSWTQVVEERTGLIFDGLVTGYRLADDGTLTLNAVNHGLEAGDSVQIANHEDYDGEYAVVQKDATSFTVERLWVKAEVIDVEEHARKRRGLMFDGEHDGVTAPLGGKLQLSQGFVLEAWVRPSSANDATLLAVVAQVGAESDWNAAIQISAGVWSLALEPLHANAAPLRLSAPVAVQVGAWTHVAAVYGAEGLQLLINGQPAAVFPAAALQALFINAALAAKQRALDALRQELAAHLAAVEGDPGDFPSRWDLGTISVHERMLTSGGAVGAAPTLWRANRAVSQKWAFEKVSPWVFVIRDSAGLVLSMDGAGALVMGAPGAAQTVQQWHVDWADQYLRIWPVGSDNFLRGSEGRVWLSPWEGHRDFSWVYEGVSPATYQRLNAAIDAENNTIVRPIGSIRPSRLTIGHDGQDGSFLQGQIAEVRLWDRERTGKQVRDVMHFLLTGRETGLVGYWRLGATLEASDGRRSTFDFSVHANHGEVRGNPYPGGAVLDRHLGDGVTEAVIYSNDALFAVSEGAEYRERFEFRAPGWRGPRAPFAPSLWGRLSREGDKQTFGPSGLVEVSEPGSPDGWFTVHWRFIVPEGVRLMRCFEVTDVKGDWSTLEVRRHTITVVSNTVSRTRSEEVAQLAGLGFAGESPDDPERMLRDLERRQAEERQLVTAYDQTDKRLALARNTTELDRQIQYETEVIDYGLRQVAQITQTIAAEQAKDAGPFVPIQNPLKPLVLPTRWSPLTPLQLRYVETSPVFAPEGAEVVGLEFYEKGDRLAPRLYCQRGAGEIFSVDNKDLTGQEYLDLAAGDGTLDLGIIQCKPGFSVRGFRFRPTSPIGNLLPDVYVRNDQGVTAWLAPNVPNGPSPVKMSGFPVQLNDPVMVAGPTQKLMSLQFKLVGSLPDVPRFALVLGYRDRTEELRQVEARRGLLQGIDNHRNILAGLQTLKANLLSAITDMEAALRRLTSQLEDVRREIARLSTAFLEEAANRDNRAEVMPTVPGQHDPRGLRVCGSLLGDIRPYSRIQAIESCTGRVTLSYQDRDNRVCHSHFDTCYDQDGKGEEWIPERFRSAGELNGTPIKLPHGIFDTVKDQVTIEFWARSAATLGANANPAVFLMGLRLGVLAVYLPHHNAKVEFWAGTPFGDGLSKDLDLEQTRGRWTHWAFVKNVAKGEMQIFVDGKLWHSTKSDDPQGAKKHTQAIADLGDVYLGGTPTSTNWQGQVAELRIWDVALSAAEVEANAGSTLSGNEPGLVAYYPFSEAVGAVARDHTGRPGRDLEGVTWVPCTAPIGRDVETQARANALGFRQVNTIEYARVRVDAQRNKLALMTRCLALPTASGVELFDEQRIEELELKWIGNAQIKPTLIGYIEGPPPVPTENLTEEEDYNGATSVELIQSSDVQYSWTRDQDVSLGAKAELFFGAEAEVSAGIAMQMKILKAKLGFKGELDLAYHWQNASTVGTGHSVGQTDRLELRGNQEADAHFPHLGRRFIPKNIGYALVTSGLADVFVSKLKRTGRMIGYNVLPVGGDTIDVNTITFLINPAYVMSGSLDGLTGSRATSDRFFGHVPEMRNRYGSLYPASYFRLREAYDLKTQIEFRDATHQAYFNQFNAGLVDEASLGREIDKASDSGKTPALGGAPDGSGAQDAKVKDLESQVRALGKEVRSDKKRLRDGDTTITQTAIDDKEDRLADLNDELLEAYEDSKEGQQDAAATRGAEIQSKFDDLSDRTNASTSFASWQRKMEDLQVRAGKRNIVNTYVWDGDGGFHAEEQQFASTVQHSIGGSFNLGIGLGLHGEVEGGMAAELTALATLSLTQTMSKAMTTSKGMELRVDLGGVESRNITDFRDQPIQPGEKVDRYRFMSFFLENNAAHWHDFFNEVVDPEWLASNDEEARALRQAQTAAPNSVWRVLHRVTYVERPALMGFGRPPVRAAEAVDAVEALADQVASLKAEQQAFQRKVLAQLAKLTEPKP